MNDTEPAAVTWHHGLMARWWAEFVEPEAEELAYYRAAIERFGQPALDLGCGAGFRELEAVGAYGGAPATGDDEAIVLIGRRPA